MNSAFPPLPLDRWRDTRDTIAGYAKVVGKVRRALAPFQKHWWHVSLRAGATGLTTTPIPAASNTGEMTFELLLDLTGHQLIISSSHGDWYEVDFDGQSSREFCDDVLQVLGLLGVEITLDPESFSDEDGIYDADAAEMYWQAASQIDRVFKEFGSGLREEISPVQLWPHHFDLAMLWFSGRKVPDYDPTDLEKAEYADEQMNFGFSTGDGTIPEPYFYITAYPWPAGLEKIALPKGARWQEEGFQGAVLPYEALTQADDPRSQLLGFLQTVQAAGQELMVT